jgi:hypothetical protein
MPVSGPAASRSSKLLLEAFSFHPEAAYGRAYGWAFHAPACAIPPPGAKNLTPSLSNMLMRTPARKEGATAGRDHPWPSSIGMGGRPRSEFPADFFGPRNAIDRPSAALSKSAKVVLGCRIFRIDVRYVRSVSCKPCVLIRVSDATAQFHGGLPLPSDVAPPMWTCD